MGRWRRTGGVLVVALVGLAAVPAGEVAARDTVVRDVAAPVPGTAEAAQAAAGRPSSPDRPPRQATPVDRYEPAGGCYTLRSERTDGHVALADGTLRATGDADRGLRFHLEPTALGRYLLFSPEQRFLGAPPGFVADLVGEVGGSSPGAMASGLTRGLTDRLLEEVGTGPLGDASGRAASVGLEPEPSELTDWELVEEGDAFRMTLVDGGPALAFDEAGTPTLVVPGSDQDAERVTLHLAEGCAAFPDIETGVAGPVVGGETPYGPVRGYLDAHLHGQAFEFLGGRARCGRPWHPYGVEAALTGCPEHELLGGRTHVLETALSGRDPVAGHDTTGWPTFVDWPAQASLTYEQTYHRWLERAWEGGLRMYVNLLVDNNVLCDVYPFTRNSCNEMDAVRLQAERMREFEAYIDAQHGGPGLGWLRIVEDPFEARRVMNEGKLAVVLGIEVSVLFDCGLQLGEATCGTAQIDEQLDEVYDLGVRQMEIVNKFDNALSGVAGDSGETGLLVGAANVLETGSFWRMGSCEGLPDHATDRTQPNVPDEAGLPDQLTARDALVGVVLDEVGTSGLAPVYGAGPHCNELGMTDLGAYVIEQMMERGMLFDPDHMSARARQDALDLLEDHGYAGVISSHSWADPDVYERILRLGGVVTPMAGTSSGFVEEWEQQREWADDRFAYGLGFGSDINGFATQGAPRGADGPNPVVYPFEGFGGTVISQQVSGERVYDVNVDGVAHYGLYPDWIEDLRRQAGSAIIDDLERGPEAYLQMWERAVGVAPDTCREDVGALTDRELAEVRRGDAAESVLVALGQPRSRDGAAFTYCLGGDRLARVVFGPDGRVRAVHRGTGEVPPVPTAATWSDDDRSTAEAVRTSAAADGVPDDRGAHDHDHDELAGTAVPAEPPAADPVPETAASDPTLDAAASDGATSRERGVGAAQLEARGDVGGVQAAGTPSRTGPIQLALVLLGLAAVAVHRTARLGRASP